MACAVTLPHFIDTLSALQLEKMAIRRTRVKQAMDLGLSPSIRPQTRRTNLTTLRTYIVPGGLWMITLTTNYSIYCWNLTDWALPPTVFNLRSDDKNSKPTEEDPEMTEEEPEAAWLSIHSIDHSSPHGVLVALERRDLHMPQIEIYSIDFQPPKPLISLQGKLSTSTPGRLMMISGEYIARLIVHKPITIQVFNWKQAVTSGPFEAAGLVFEAPLLGHGFVSPPLTRH
ncbi:hypothetical protein FRB90_011826 [Tulasnella sp. 427]|nr:hypothetical protein FRB90_011826 [Tulasnella sp. 427]